MNSLNFNITIHFNYFLVIPVGLTVFCLPFPVSQSFLNKYKRYALFINEYITGKLNNKYIYKIINKTLESQ